MKSVMQLDEVYDADFFAADTRQISASRVWPVVLECIGTPRSVVDFGCGVGAWLAAVTAIDPSIAVVGVDHPGVPKEMLQIPARNFIGARLEAPLDLRAQYDLSMGLEVAEHLPESAANTYVDLLTGHAANVLFSAAIPGQGGVHHVNEQWPSYWIKKFNERGY